MGTGGESGLVLHKVHLCRMKTAGRDCRNIALRSGNTGRKGLQKHSPETRQQWLPVSVLSLSETSDTLVRTPLAPPNPSYLF